MTQMQRRLYDTVAMSHQAGDLSRLLQPGDADVAASAPRALASQPSGVLEALMFLRKLCSHPGLVFDWRIGAHADAARAALHVETADAATAALASLAQTPKLTALRQILCDCNIIQGSSQPSASGSGGGSAVDSAAVTSAHRALVFAQLKGTLDAAEQLLLAPEGVSFLRIDGDVPADMRSQRVARFNADPTIDVMLLTTGVGGLGLNLSSADTVVFLEHDWNPMKDLQVRACTHSEPANNAA